MERQFKEIITMGQSQSVLEASSGLLTDGFRNTCAPINTSALAETYSYALLGHNRYWKFRTMRVSLIGENLSCVNIQDCLYPPLLIIGSDVHYSSGTGRASPFQKPQKCTPLEYTVENNQTYCVYECVCDPRCKSIVIGLGGGNTETAEPLIKVCEIELR